MPAINRVLFSAAVLGMALSATSAHAGTGTYRSPDEVTLPPQSQRVVVGTWFDKDSHCTRSLERVKAKVFLVARCSDGSGGDTGTEVRAQQGQRYASLTSTHGDYYRIEADGQLGVYDREGLVDKLPKHATLKP